MTNLWRRWQWRDPIKRIRCAWHVLRGRPLAYRINTRAPFIVDNERHMWIVEVFVDGRLRQDPPGWATSGIVVGGQDFRID